MKSLLRRMLIRLGVTLVDADESRMVDERTFGRWEHD
jgi:hypothetical protein